MDFFFPCGFFSGVSPGPTTWHCTWRGTSKVASTLTARRADSGWPSWPVGVQRGQSVLVELTGAPPCSSQWKKMKQGRLLFAPYLVPPTPRCGDCSGKGFLQKKQEGKERLRRVGRGGKWEKSWLEKMERDSSVWCSMLFTFLFPGGFWGLQGWGHHSSADSVFACVRETVSAWDWIPVLALGLGWGLHCGTVSEWHGWWDVFHFLFYFEGRGICVVSPGMNASKRFCLCQLSQFTMAGSRRGGGVGLGKKLHPVCVEVELQLPIQKWEVVSF